MKNKYKNIFNFQLITYVNVDFVFQDLIDQHLNHLIQPTHLYLQVYLMAEAELVKQYLMEDFL